MHSISKFYSDHKTELSAVTTSLLTTGGFALWNCRKVENWGSLAKGYGLTSIGMACASGLSSKSNQRRQIASVLLVAIALFASNKWIERKEWKGIKIDNASLVGISGLSLLFQKLVDKEHMIQHQIQETFRIQTNFSDYQDLAERKISKFKHELKTKKHNRIEAQVTHLSGSNSLLKKENNELSERLSKVEADLKNLMEEKRVVDENFSEIEKEKTYANQKIQEKDESIAYLQNQLKIYKEKVANYEALPQKKSGKSKNKIHMQ